MAVTSTALLRVTALVMVSSHFTKRTDVRAAKPWLLVSYSLPYCFVVGNPECQHRIHKMQKIWENEKFIPDSSNTHGFCVTAPLKTGAGVVYQVESSFFWHPTWGHFQEARKNMRYARLHWWRLKHTKAPRAVSNWFEFLISFLICHRLSFLPSQKMPANCVSVVTKSIPVT